MVHDFALELVKAAALWSWGAGFGRLSLGQRLALREFFDAVYERPARTGGAA